MSTFGVIVSTVEYSKKPENLKKAKLDQQLKKGLRRENDFKRSEIITTGIIASVLTLFDDLHNIYREEHTV